jgi:hypothetical protein
LREDTNEPCPTQTKKKKLKQKKKRKLVASYEKILTKPKKFVRQKIGTKKLVCSQKIYYKN